MTPTCETCKFFRENDPKDDECHRFPPVPLQGIFPYADMSLKYWLTSQWPAVSSADWCGEYKMAEPITYSGELTPEILAKLRSESGHG